MPRLRRLGCFGCGAFYKDVAPTALDLCLDDGVYRDAAPNGARDVVQNDWRMTKMPRLRRLGCRAKRFEPQHIRHPEHRRCDISVAARPKAPPAPSGAASHREQTLESSPLEQIGERNPSQCGVRSAECGMGNAIRHNAKCGMFALGKDRPSVNLNALMVGPKAAAGLRSGGGQAVRAAQTTGG